MEFSEEEHFSCHRFGYFEDRKPCRRRRAQRMLLKHQPRHLVKNLCIFFGRSLDDLTWFDPILMTFKNILFERVGTRRVVKGAVPRTFECRGPCSTVQLQGWKPCFDLRPVDFIVRNWNVNYSTLVGWTIRGMPLPSMIGTTESPMMRVPVNQLGFYGPIQCVRHDRWDT